MNNKGAQRWSQLMLEALNDSAEHLTEDPRIRTSINTFLDHFMAKYSQEFAFETRSYFGETNPPFKHKINFMRMTTEAIEALSEDELSGALAELGVDVSLYENKAALVSKALIL